MELLRRLIRDEEGQGLAEYAMILGLIALAVAAALTSLGTSMSGLFTQITNAFQGQSWPF
jgi:pilus assembly protein Flp/PilA